MLCHRGSHERSWAGVQLHLLQGLKTVHGDPSLKKRNNFIATIFYKKGRATTWRQRNFDVTKKTNNWLQLDL